MATLTQSTRSTPALRNTLNQLRTRIRLYVFAQGLSLAMAWVALTYWVAVAIDYLPVAMGLTDLPRGPRAFMLLGIATVLGFILYWWILRKVFVRLSDRNMAMLLERRYDEFQDSLITSVELAPRHDSQDPFIAKMIAAAEQEAAVKLPGKSVNRVFNPLPLAIGFASAAVSVGSLLIFALIFPSQAALGAKRLYLLDDQSWPRSCHLAEVGATVSRNYEMPGIPVEADHPRFVDGRLKVGEGSTLSLWVRAETATEDRPDRRVPDTCQLRFRTDEGETGSIVLQADGVEAKGLQTFRFEGDPFDGMVADTRFSIRGGDHRLTNQVIEIVDNPAIIHAEMDCDFPDYMVDYESGSWTPRTIKIPSGFEIPNGTHVVLRFRTNKPIEVAYVHLLGSQQALQHRPRAGASDEFELDLGVIDQSDSMQIALLDSDGVLSASLFEVQLATVEDKAPVLKKDLPGIGRAVTPRVLLPIQGTVEDDYGLDESWLEIRGTDIDVIVDDVQVQPGRLVDHRFDFDKLAKASSNPVQLVPDEGHVISITLKATDRFNLGTRAHTGHSDTIELEVVSESQLLRILERSEVGQRQILQQIHDEMSEAQVLLMRTQIEIEQPDAEDESATDSNNDSTDPLSATSTDDSDDVSPISADELKLLFARRALMQTRKSASELNVVHDSFVDIRLQMINNRIDAIEQIGRLQEFVIEPLNTVTEEHFPALTETIRQLEEKLIQLPLQPGDEVLQLEINLAADEAVVQAQELLNELDRVLARLEKYESYSELLDRIRDIIADQEDLMDDTENARKRQGLDDLRGGR